MKSGIDANKIAMADVSKYESEGVSMDYNRQYLDKMRQLASLLVKKYLLRKEPQVLDTDDTTSEVSYLNSEAPFRSIDEQIAQTRQEVSFIIQEAQENGTVVYLEQLAKVYELDEFEKRVVLLLFLAETDPGFKRELGSVTDIKTLQSETGRLKIGDIIEILCSDYHQKLAARSYFSRNGRLIKHSVVDIAYPREDAANILRLELLLPVQITNYILGDNNDYGDLDRSMRMEESNTSFDDVVLDDEQKEQLKQFLDGYDEYMQGIMKHGFQNMITYGSSTVFLFYGPSGTGKTMLAKAIANYLKKPVLTINFGEFDDTFYYSIRSGLFRKAFRRAQVLGAIVFIDECEQILDPTRPLSRPFLIEVENYRGIVILATTHAFRLNPSMDRRITLKLNLSVPNREKRKRIWDIHLRNKLVLSEDVDLDFLSRRFLFTGGLIKNSVLVALANAMRECPDRPIVAHEALVKAAEQVEKQILNPLYACQPYYPLSANAGGTHSVLSLSVRDKEKVNSIVGLLRSCATSSYQPRILWYGAEAKQLIRLSETIAQELERPLTILPCDLFWEKDSTYFHKFGDRFGNYYQFLEHVLGELEELECIVAVVDYWKELFVSDSIADKKVSKMDVVERTLNQIKRPVFLLYPARVLPARNAARHFVDYVFQVDSTTLEERADIWSVLWKQNVVVAPEVTPDKLAQESNLSNLNRPEIERAIRRLVVGFWLGDRSAVTMNQIQRVGQEIHTSPQELSLFGFGRKERLGIKPDIKPGTRSDGH